MFRQCQNTTGILLHLSGREQDKRAGTGYAVGQPPGRGTHYFLPWDLRPSFAMVQGTGTNRTWTTRSGSNAAESQICGGKPCPPCSLRKQHLSKQINYFMPGRRNTHFLGCDVVKQHHTLTQILMGLLNHGFELKAVEEAKPPEEMMGILGMEDELRRPMMLLVKATVKK